MSTNKPTTAAVDFYVVSTGGPDEVARFACRLTEKICRMGHQVFVHTPDRKTAAQFDQLLWTFREDSFVPHCLDDGTASPYDAVLIGSGDPTSSGRDVLVNLAPAAPQWATDYARIAELVPPDPAGRSAGRERFKFYRALGCEVRSHDV